MFFIFYFSVSALKLHAKEFIAYKHSDKEKNGDIVNGEKSNQEELIAGKRHEVCTNTK